MALYYGVMGDPHGTSAGSPPRVDDLLANARHGRSLEEQRALADLEQKLFGRRPRPVNVSRYVLLDRIGAGGVGVVYRAYDPELDRRVAIKVLQATAEDAGGRSRLIREAQSLARLTHPNVITVYDAGTYDEVDLGLDPGAEAPDLEIPRRGVFLVMEFVAGRDLQRWLSGGIRPWQDVLDIFVDAGRGLAAAHAAGITHRDFKPSNVLLGDDGRVRVLDFGVARFAAEHQSESAAFADPPSEQELETREGALVGTPRYMAPEQHEGGNADARSDQFAFAVSLFEAIFHKAPFLGEYDAMVEAKHAGPPMIPTRPAVPTRIANVLRRALQPDPEHRFESMEALLHTLEPPRAPRWPRVLVGASAVLSVGLLVGLFVARTTDDPCGGAPEHLANLWPTQDAERARTAFAATELPYAAPAFAAVSSTLETYRARWADGYRDACEATHVRHEQSSDALDLRMRCLDDTLRQASAVLDRFQDADASVVENAVSAVENLPDPRACDDVDTLATRLPLPRDPALRARLAEGREQLAAARASELASDYDQAAWISRAVESRAVELDYLPLRAEALMRLASAQIGAGEFDTAAATLLETIWTAEASRHDEVAADAWIALVWVDGVERRLVDHNWVPFARAALDRLPDEPLRRATFEHNVAGVHYANVRYQEALTGYRRALEIQRQELGPRNLAVARTLNHIGNVLMEYDGPFEEALAACEESLAIRRDILGEAHPLVAASLSNISTIQQRLGRPRDALRAAREAFAMTRGTGGPEEWFAAHAVVASADPVEQHAEAVDAVKRLIELAPTRKPYAPNPPPDLLGQLERLLQAGPRRTSPSKDESP